jgi:hypothetical protein
VDSVRNITPVLEKVRPTTHRGNGSGPEPEVGLSERRLSLVHRYMVDAEQAAALGIEAAPEEAYPGESAPATAAREQAELAAERTRRRIERERRRAQKLGAHAASAKPNADAAADETPVDGAVGNGSPDAREAVRATKALAKADRRAAKHAARQIAALEKKEARERKALAKAAARRRPE